MKQKTIFLLILKTWQLFTTNTTTWGWTDPKLDKFQKKVMVKPPTKGWFLRVGIIFAIFIMIRFGILNFQTSSLNLKNLNAHNAWSLMKKLDNLKRKMQLILYI